MAMAVAGCRRAEYRTASGAVWGTTYHITYCADRDLTDSILAQMRQVELSLSAFDAQSLVSKINDNRSDAVDHHFRSVFAVAKSVYDLSGGAFDPSVGPLVQLWGFGKDKTAAEPDSAAIAATLQRVCFGRCYIDGDRLVKPRPDVVLDFSAIAKGYGVDCVAQMLRHNGVTDFMVEIGGEVAVSGVNPRSQPWHIMVDAPQRDTAPGDSAIQVLELTDEAVATSGNYRNYRRTASGQIYGHTINPHTGLPAESTVLSATVVCATCVEADALATACMVLAPDSALVMLSRANARALLVVADVNDSYRIISTLE